MTQTTEQTWVMPTWLRPWEQFWFTPRDPSLLGVIRLLTGMIVVYVLFAYSFNLQDFVGEHAWHDLQLRNSILRERPVGPGGLGWYESGDLPEPKDEWQRTYKERYRDLWGAYPPPPYPETVEEVEYLNQFRVKYKVDVRGMGLPIPKTEFERIYAEAYTEQWQLPPPAFPKNPIEAEEIERYMDHWKEDPRRLHTKGMPIFSLWFHVTDPVHQSIIHTLLILAAFMFMLGLCTRLTSAVTWFAYLCYIHRTPTTLFGVDTMITITLFYLMMSPSGAFLSLDRVIQRWWATAKPGIIQAWCRFWRRDVPDLAAIAPATPVADPLIPTVSANVAIRLLQVNVCIIYLMAGLSKLLGPAWWNGTAIWYTLASYEFAPMQYPIYLDFLLLIGKNHLVYEAFITGGGLFTLIFEIGYTFLIWRPRLRWVYLASAILLHGGIGLFMGLKTFSLIMLVMNMAFLRKEEVLWIFGVFKPGRSATTREGDEAPAEPVSSLNSARQEPRPPETSITARTP